MNKIFPFTSSSLQQQQQRLPCRPGHVMGGVVPSSELELPYLYDEKEKLKIEIHKCSEIIKDLRAKIYEPKENLQNKIIDAHRQRERLRCSKKEIKEKIYRLNDQIDQLNPYEATLPVDYDKSSLKLRYIADPSECMHSMYVDQTAQEADITNFVKYFTKIDELPEIDTLIKQISQLIIQETKKTQSRMYVLGSFITLSCSRILDPIILRENAILNREILKHVNDYSVISEAALGGIFIGFGMELSAQEQRMQNQSDQAVASQLNVFSFVSKGAIPSGGSNSNLWNCYINWKEKLLLDKYCGFPIAFKVRELRYVLKENNCLFPDLQDKKLETVALILEKLGSVLKDNVFSLQNFQKEGQEVVKIGLNLKKIGSTLESNGGLFQEVQGKGQKQEADDSPKDQDKSIALTSLQKEISEGIEDFFNKQILSEDKIKIINYLKEIRFIDPEGIFYQFDQNQIKDASLKKTMANIDHSIKKIFSKEKGTSYIPMSEQISMASTFKELIAERLKNLTNLTVQKNIFDYVFNPFNYFKSFLFNNMAGGNQAPDDSQAPSNVDETKGVNFV
ncbi:MAG: hypothetical protein QRY72_03220 [Candidatus Rhabdochlamydia sp.]